MDGDDQADPIVYEQSTGNWFAVGSTGGFSAPALNFGGPAFTPLVGDIDGDGQADPIVYEQSTGNWFAVGSTGGFTILVLGFGG